MKIMPALTIIALFMLPNVYASNDKLELDEKTGLNGIGTEVPFELDAIKKHLKGYEIIEASSHEGNIIMISDSKDESLASIIDSGDGYNKIIVYSEKVLPKVSGRIGDLLENMYFASDESIYREFCESSHNGNIQCYTRAASKNKSKHIQHVYAGDNESAKGELPSLKVAKKFKIVETLWLSNPSEKASGDFYFDIKTMKWHDSQGVCNSCTAENGFPVPAIQDGFYFHPETKKWHDKHGPCNSCIPENGFPAKPLSLYVTNNNT